MRCCLVCERGIGCHNDRVLHAAAVPEVSAASRTKHHVVTPSVTASSEFYHPHTRSVLVGPGVA